MQQPSVNGRRILLVEDHDDVRETIRLLLEMDGYGVVEAKDADQALERAARDRFDLIMTDYALPGILGDELARQFKQLGPTRPVILLSGSADDLRPSSDGADLVLNKPFRLEELQQAVSRLCQTKPVSPSLTVPPPDASSTQSGGHPLRAPAL